jgi:hypothetical protein
MKFNAHSRASFNEICYSAMLCRMGVVFNKKAILLFQTEIAEINAKTGNFPEFSMKGYVKEF